MSQGKKAVETFLSMLNDSDLIIYRQLIEFLYEHGYIPQHKSRTKGLVISFSNLEHNRVIANMGVREGSAEPFFGLRFSSCRDYSQKFADVIRDRFLSSNNRLAKCSQCKFCKGDKFVYTYNFQDGDNKAACGAFILEIPNITEDDIEEIKRLFEEQHKYFMKHYA